MRYQVTINDYKARQWAFFTADISEQQLTAYLQNLKDGGYIESYSFTETQHLCIGLSDFSQTLVQLGLA